VGLKENIRSAELVAALFRDWLYWNGFLGLGGSRCHCERKGIVVGGNRAGRKNK